MADINHVVLVGNLTRDAELKYTQSGQAVCNFSLAVNRSVKKGEQWVKEVSYFDIVLWGRQGEAISKYLVKGKQVGVDGELRQDRWQQQDGQNRSKVVINAANVMLLGGGQGGGSGGGYPSNGGPSSGGGSYGGPSSGGGFDGGDGQMPPNDDGFSDDIPF